MTLCLSLKEVSDLGNFPNLEKLILQGCALLVSLRSSVPLPALRVVDLEGCKKLNGLLEHLDGSKDLEVLRLQKSGIVMSEEEITKLKVSCKMLVVFSWSASSKYGDGPYDQVSESLAGSNMDTGVQNLHYRSRRLWDPFPREKVTKFIYSNNGSRLQTKGEMNLLALTSSGMHKRWDWKNQEGMFLSILCYLMRISTIVIRNEWAKQVVCTLKGHRGRSRITVLSFSKFSRLLLSLGANDQING